MSCQYETDLVGEDHKVLLLLKLPFYYLISHAVQWGGVEPISSVVPEYNANQTGRDIIRKEKLIDYEYSTTCQHIQMAHPQAIAVHHARRKRK